MEDIFPNLLFLILKEAQTELFNLNCKTINFIQSLKDRCDLDPQDCVDLMDRTGQLLQISDQEHSMKPASSLMKERHSYVLICICRSDGTEQPKYVPLLNNLGKSHPELAEILKKLSNPWKDLDRKGGPSRKVFVNRSKATTGNKNNNSVKPGQW